MTIQASFKYWNTIDEICRLRWQALTSEDMTCVAWAYYFFSVQFRENLKTARSLYPLDDKLKRLEQEECETDNLSPWPDVAHPGERMNHDEYMRRTLDLSAIEPELSGSFETAGRSYLADARRLDPATRAASIASYEDGGLERVFKAILRFSRWDSPLLRSFEHFLVEHVRFDSDPEQGHGALSRHIDVDDRILPLWEGFRQLLVTCVPNLSHEANTDALRAQEVYDEIHSLPVRTGRLDTHPAVHETPRHLPAYDDPVHHP